MQSYNCKNCGAELSWDPVSQTLKCEYCDKEHTIQEFEDFTTSETVKDESVKETEYLNEEVADGMVAYECKNCGGTLVTSSTTMAEVCPYCGETISITSKSVGNFRPDLILPFHNKKEEAIEIYKQYVSKSKLTPKVFKNNNYIEKIQGLYTPFYLHSMNLNGQYEFEGEKTSSRSTSDYIITKHDVYRLITNGAASFEYVPTDASARLDNNLMSYIEPFKLDDTTLQSYNPAFMAGFVAEQADSKEDLESASKERCKKDLMIEAKKTFKEYSSVKTVNEYSDVLNYNKKYAMLPVWILTINYKNNPYTFAINGQTGKIAGKLPLDKKKFFGSIATCAAIIYTILTAIGLFLQNM